ADEDTVLGTRPMLSLNNSVDTDGDILVYDFQVCSDSQMTSLVASGTDILQGEGITYWQAASDLLEERWYWWRARSSDGVCYSDWSGERKFYAKRWIAEVEDSQPTLRNPADGATLKNSQPTLEVYNITGFESLVYYFQLDSDTQFTNPVQSGGVVEGSAITSWIVANSLSKGNYCWRARAFDGSNFSRWSEAGRFTVAPEVYVYPNPFKPSSGDENITFTNIPLGSDIKIATLDGKLVKKFTNTQDNEIIWDAKNQEGKDVASGVYLYFVDFPGGSTSGKIVVVR
ncbi:MAG: T9SS type A sorting domain-containing protein, partial [candidate division Zixibacteria bacterium]|nr:T9SS type A sorting domain-containing protein [candidate division Zixibacteria bacterium]